MKYEWKYLFLLCSLITIHCSLFAQQDTLGFINKAEAKNQMVNGKKEGKWIEYKDKGMSDTGKYYAGYYMLDVYKDGKLNGIARLFTINGVLMKKITYVSGERDGMTWVYYSDGTIESEIPYKQDKIDGAERDFYECGRLKEQTVYVADRKNGMQWIYYETGELEWGKGYINDTLDGCVREYRAGKLARSTTYKKGVINGNISVFYQDGKLWYTIPYVNGKIMGIEKWYYEDGKLKSEIPRNDGQIDGTEKEYYNTGKLESETDYSNGQKGATKYFDENGKEIK